MKYLKKFESYVSEKLSEQELDRILDKISKSGIESLTKREKAELDNADNPNFKYVETPEPKQTEYKPDNNKEKMETEFKTLDDIRKQFKSIEDILTYCGVENDSYTDLFFEFQDDEDMEYLYNDEYEDGVLTCMLGLSDGGGASDSDSIGDFFELVSKVILPESKRNFFVDWDAAESMCMVFPNNGVKKSDVDLEQVKKHIKDVVDFTESII